MNGAELLVDVNLRQALVSDLRQNPPLLSVARPSNRPGSIRKPHGNATVITDAETTTEQHHQKRIPQQSTTTGGDAALMMITSNQDDEYFVDDDGSSSTRLSATASPSRGDGADSRHLHLSSTTPNRSLNAESPSPQSQRTRIPRPTSLATRATPVKDVLSSSQPTQLHTAVGGELTLPDTTARLLVSRPASSSSVSLFPVIPIADALRGLPKRLTFGSAATTKTITSAGDVGTTVTPREEITKNTLAILTSPHVRRVSATGSALISSSAAAGGRRSNSLTHALPRAPLPAHSSTMSACSDPDVEAVTGAQRHNLVDIDGDDEELPLQATPTTTSNRFAGVGTSSMSASVEKDLMMTDKIVRRIAEEFEENRRRCAKRYSNGGRVSSSSKKSRSQQSNQAAAGHTTKDSGNHDWDMVFLSSVMSVSNVYHSIASTTTAKPSVTGAPQHFLARREELTAMHSTRIPQEYWVTRDPIQQPRSTPSAAATAGNLMQALNDKIRVLAFPSTNPGNRPEVYLLARTLDQMVADTVPDYNLLNDASAAYAILPTELTAGACEENATAVGQLYSSVVRGFMQVVDVGFSEIARQIASACPERAALLDSMRQCCSDVHSTLLDVVEHSKRRAFEEAIRRQQYDDIISTKNRQIIDGLTKVTSLEERVLTLETQLETNAMKAARFDELVSRMDLREQQRQRAIVRVDQLELLDDAEEAVSRAAMLAAAAYEDLGNPEAGATKPPESTMARLERLRQEEDERNHALLYEGSVKLLKALRTSVEATDAACAPLYDRMLFGKPELNIAVASGRWASIGRAIGEHEAVWDHRERVAKAHALWLEVMTTKANARSRVLPIGAVFGTDGPTEQKSSSSSIREFECSVEQLRAMGIHDVTPDEIMMLQREDFDSDHFLHPSQRIPPRWGLKNAGVAQMLSDAEMTFTEITLRLEALKQSELLGDVSKPPLMPPSRPSEPCSLCNRRDIIEMEKRQHRTLVDNLLKELGEREAEGQSEVKLAQEERDKAKSQLEAQFDICQKLEERLAMLESQMAMTQRMGGSNFDEEAVTSSLGSQQPLLEVSVASPRASSSMAAGGGGAAIRGVGDVLLADSNQNGRSSSTQSNSRLDVDTPAEVKSSSSIRRSSRRSSSVLSVTSRGSRSPTNPPLQRTMTSSRQRSPILNGSVAEKPHSEATSPPSAARATSSLIRKTSTLAKTASMLKKKSTLKGSTTSKHSPSPHATDENSGSTVAGDVVAAAPIIASSVTISSTLPSGPVVIQLVINCSCCGGGVVSTAAAGSQPNPTATAPPATLDPNDIMLLTSQDSLNIQLEPAPSGTNNDLSPPRRPATGERRKVSNVSGSAVEDGGGVVPAAVDGVVSRKGSISMFTTGKHDGSLSVGDDGGAAAVSDFIAGESHLDSFVNAPDPIATHSQAIKRHASSGGTLRGGPMERTSTRAALRTPQSGKELSRQSSARTTQQATDGNARNSSVASPRLSSAGSRAGSGVILSRNPTEADPFGELVAVVEDPLADGEGGSQQRQRTDGTDSPNAEFRGDNGGSFLIARTGQESVAQSMWTQMEGQLLHRLRSSAIAASMSAQGAAVGVPPNAVDAKVPKPPAEVRRPAGSATVVDRGLSANKLRHASGGNLHQDEIARVSSTKTINTMIDSDLTEAALEKGFKEANEKLRQGILKLSGRIESMNATSVRTAAWLLKNIGGFYRAKRMADATAENSGHAYTASPDFLLTFLKRKLGAKEVVYEHLHYIYTTCRALKTTDLRIRQFMEVMFVYNNRQAAFFLQLSLALECCAIGLDYSVSHQHFALDEHPTKPEVVCLRRIAAVLTETGLHKRPYAPFLWKALSHRSLAFEVEEDRFYESLRKSGMEAEGIQHHPPSSWTVQDVSLMRVVVLKSAFLSLICGFEMKLQAAMQQQQHPPRDVAVLQLPPGEPHRSAATALLLRATESHAPFDESSPS